MRWFNLFKLGDKLQIIPRHLVLGNYHCDSLKVSFVLYIPSEFQRKSKLP